MDVLISLALASNYFVGPTCRPSIKDTTKLLNDEAHSPYLHAKELGHPVLSSQSGSGCFVPNDVNIGGHINACFMLLTGPNMGGKINSSLTSMLGSLAQLEIRQETSSYF